MRSKIFIPVVAVTIVLLMAFSTTTNNDAKVPEQAYIQVTGSAEKEVVPDEVYLSITLKEFMDGKNKVTLEKLEKQLVKAVNVAEIDEKQLGLDDLNSQFRRYKRKKLDVFEQRQYELKITDMKKIAALMNAIQNIEIYSLDVARVSHSEIEKFRKEVKIAAAKAAKEKAGYLLAAMDAKVGKPLEVIEVDVYANVYANRSLGVANYKKSEVINYENNLAFKPITLRYKIQAKFAIE